MATGIVITVAEKVLGELNEICSKFGFESQLDDLKTTVNTIKSIMLDAESKHQEFTDGVRDYIEMLKDAVYDVDDMLDEFNTIVLNENNNMGGKTSTHNKVRRFFSRTNRLNVAYNMSKQIKNLSSKLDKIAKDHQQFGLKDVYVPLKRRAENMSFASEDNIIGRETDKEAIVGMLLRHSVSSNNVGFVTIVGMGGMGKTALAQLVYNDPKIEKAFALRLWVSVSDDFSLDNIFRQMLGKDGSTTEELQREVRKLIEGKRYLLVLDDVWNENQHEWDDLKSFLNLGGKGSRVVVTSRLEKVASVVGDELMYELQGLSDENSWNLFKRLAFEQGKEPTDSNDPLFDVGKEIVKRCCNIPLPIRVVGSMLHDAHERKWLSVKSDILMEIGQGDDGVMPILKYSFYHLTPALKSCFCYCALFPKDFKIKKELLIRLWLAQGFLESPHDHQCEEDVGEEYFSILLHRCFFQDIEKDSYGEIASCKMHDMIHDLALYVTGNESTMMPSVVGESNKRISHVSSARSGCFLANSITQPNEMKTWRTFLMFSLELSTEVAKSNVTAICSRARRLRVLDLHSYCLETLPHTVGNLFHLRYLDLSGNWNLEVLPKSITKLLNLLALNLDDTGVRELPRDMKKLINLRHLSLRGCYYLSHMPLGLNSLTSLHILTTFVAGDETSSQGKICKLRELKDLVNLRDELTIDFKENFSCDVADYHEVELLRLAPLKHLNIQFNDKGAANHETLLGCLQPHCRLLSISIKGYRGSKLPSWVESLATSLPHLVRIHLEDYYCLEILPSLSQLRHLKYLTLECIYNVEFVESDFQLIFFPSLEELELKDFPKLKGWWREETSKFVTGEGCASSLLFPSFPRLHMLVLSDCPNLTAFPLCPKLLSLKLRKCHETLSLVGSKTTSFVLYLETLNVDNVEALNYLFKESLGGVQQLVIEYFEGESLSNSAVEAVLRLNIQNLSILNCNNLKSLSGFVEHLTCLQSLTIRNCENLVLENIGGVSSLTLINLPKLLNLPKAFCDLTSLEYLVISDCENLEGLPEWLNCLTSLQRLIIWGCSKLKSLPEAIAHMHSLKTLDLFANEDLVKRCKEPDGEDWPKICHIPRRVLLK